MLTVRKWPTGDGSPAAVGFSRVTGCSPGSWSMISPRRKKVAACRRKRSCCGSSVRQVADSTPHTRSGGRIVTRLHTGSLLNARSRPNTECDGGYTEVQPRVFSSIQP